MLFCLVHTFRPNRPDLVSAAQLSRKNDIESVHLLLGPFDAGAHQQRRKTHLKCGNGIPDYGEVNKRYFPDVLMEVTLKDTLPSIIISTGEFTSMIRLTEIFCELCSRVPPNTLL